MLTFENASFSQSFGLLSIPRQCFCPEKTYGCSCIIVLYCIPASMTENVLDISVLWQLCIRLIYGMAFEYGLRYKKTIFEENLKIYYLSLLFLISIFI